MGESPSGEYSLFLPGWTANPRLNSVLTDLEAKGQVSVHEWLEVETACYHGAGWTLVLSSGEVMEADYLICATGALVDVATDPLLAGLQEAHPLKMKNGLPVLTENLQWPSKTGHSSGGFRCPGSEQVPGSGSLFCFDACVPQVPANSRVDPRWGRLPVYLMGNLAALHLGPDAVNMTGAARGALRIWSALSGCEGCEVS